MFMGSALFKAPCINLQLVIGSILCFYQNVVHLDFYNCSFPNLVLNKNKLVIIKIYKSYFIRTCFSITTDDLTMSLSVL